jgi:hypothetical protein
LDFRSTAAFINVRRNTYTFVEFSKKKGGGFLSENIEIAVAELLDELNNGRLKRVKVRRSNNRLQLLVRKIGNIQIKNLE